MKRLYLLLVARYHDLRVFAHEVRHDDALRRLNAAKREIANADACMAKQLDALRWAKAEAKNAWYDVAKCDRHRMLGI